MYFEFAGFLLFDGWIYVNLDFAAKFAGKSWMFHCHVVQILQQSVGVWVSGEIHPPQETYPLVI
jgi:hypothetical protein